MNLASVMSTYNVVGAERCNALLFKPTIVKKDRFTSDAVVDSVFRIIKKHAKITRSKLIKSCLLSPSTINFSVNILIERKDIYKTLEMSDAGRPVTYSVHK